MFEDPPHPFGRLDSPEGTLVFGRGDALVCAVNSGAEPVRLPEYGAVLPAGGALPGGGILPGDTAVWYAVDGR
ncbi:hypothetical protein ACIBSV_34410 [Embleya sp. NPDC050154]|uniref:hypothetical protein n=1 Tax=Embleya sp. NPDC050154 TaxID=3363988 RepID=UPI0037A07EF6